MPSPNTVINGVTNYNDGTNDDGSKTTCDVNGAINGGDNYLVMQGSFTLTENAISYTDRGASFGLKQLDTARNDTFQHMTPQWYISVTDDINTYIGFCDSNANNFNDDAWRIKTAATYSSAAGSSVTEFKLPSATINDVSLAKFTACDATSTREWRILADITLGTGGTTMPTVTVDAINLVDMNDGNANVDTSFSKMTGSLIENVQKAQLAYWNDSQTNVAGLTPAASDADKLTCDLTASMIQGHNGSGSNATTLIENEINGDVLTSWAITLTTNGFDTTSNLSKFAHAAGKNSSSVFTTDDKIVIDSPQLYTHTITDSDGNNHVLANDFVYGVIIQS